MMTSGEEHDGRRRCCGAGGGRGRGALVEPAVLAALARGEAHGYDLLPAISELTGVVADPGGLYRILRRLEEEGCVTSRWIEGEAGPQRREYSLTLSGRDLLEHWRQHIEDRQRALAALGEAIDDALGREMAKEEDK